MTLWVVFQNTDFCPNVWEERLYNAVVGVTEYGPDDESIACCRSLRKLTGEPMGADAGAWQRWWAENHARYQPHEDDTKTTGGAPPEKRND